MHRRDYVLIAKCLKKVKSEAGKVGVLEKAIMDKVIFEFCLSFKEETNSFNEQKFRDYIQKGE